VRQEERDAIGNDLAFVLPEIIEVFNRAIGQANGERHD
jgi:hypothetical protein